MQANNNRILSKHKEYDNVRHQTIRILITGAGSYVGTSVEKWLAGFIAGKFMVVDSFHAMVFSIIFQRDFVVIGNKKRGLSRFESLLKGLGLADRLVFNKDEALMVAGRPINWDNVQERINSLRDKSYCFLQNALGK